MKDYVAGWHQRAQEMFVPLVHPPGHAQADFGEAIGVIGGVERKIHFFAFDLPHSDACFVVGYPAETTSMELRDQPIQLLRMMDSSSSRDELCGIGEGAELGAVSEFDGARQLGGPTADILAAGHDRRSE